MSCYVIALCRVVLSYSSYPVLCYVELSCTVLRDIPFSSVVVLCGCLVHCFLAHVLRHVLLWCFSVYCCCVVQCIAV